MRYGLTTHQRKSSGLTPKYTSDFRKPPPKHLNGFLILKNLPVSRTPEIGPKESWWPVYLISSWLMINRSPNTVLAYAISFRDITYCTEDGTIILVTVSDEVNIVIPASSTRTTISILTLIRYRVLAPEESQLSPNPAHRKWRVL